MNEAIQLAIEGGYRSEPLGGDFRGSNEYQMRAMRNEIEWRDKVILSDPLFWQALGKALGWGKYQDIDTTEYGMLHYANGTIFGWLAVWHRFIDWIAEGKDEDDFFKQLISQQ